MYSRPPQNDMPGYGTALPGPAERRPNWWLRLTSVPANPNDTSFAAREHVRRSRLASYLMIGVLAVDILAIPLTIGSVATIIALAAVFFGLIIVAICNRLGWVTFSAIFLIILITAAIFGTILTEPNGLTMFDMPGYDLLTITVIIGASILNPISGFFIAAINAALIILDFDLQPHAADVVTNINLFGATGLLARPIALLVVVALVGWLWVRGTLREVVRANRAEEIAAVEHAYAEQRRQLEIGVQQILATHVRIANGDFKARAPMTQDNVLWQVAASLNNLVVRLQGSMAQAAQTSRAAYQLQRTEDEALRLAEALRDLQAGRQPIWPQQTGTVIDQLIAVVRPNRLAAPHPGSSWGMPAQGGRSPFPPNPQSQAGASPNNPASWASPNNPASWASPFAPYPETSERLDMQSGGQPEPGSRYMPRSESSGQPYPSTQPERPSAGFDDNWPSLARNDTSAFQNPSTGDGSSSGQQSDPFPPLNNPWYLPPDE